VQRYLGGKVVIKVGDITAEDVEALINAANRGLMGGGGVDGAIHRAGGPQILEECKQVRKLQYPEGLPDGEAVMTGAGDLEARWVIHTVGPVWKGGSKDEEEKLENCYRNSLRLAAEENVKTIAAPAISTGIYRFPKEEASKIASRSIKEFFKKESSVKQIILVFFSENDARIFTKYQVFNEN